MAVTLDRSPPPFTAPDSCVWPAMLESDRRWHQRRPTDTGWVALAAFVAYMCFALWIRYGLGYIINDSLARTANAVYVIGSRDPHLGAIGFYWPPLHSLAQVPLIPLLQPLGLSELAGPIVSALSMAGTVAVLGALGRRVGAPRGVNLVICLLFAFSPLMIFYGANGMGEASFFLFVALAFHGYVGWTRTGRTGALATAALALAGAELIRYEALLLVAVLAVCGGLHLRRLRRSLTAVVALALPAVFAFIYLLVLQLVLVRDPFFFLKVGTAASPKPEELLRYVPDVQNHPFSAVTWSLSRTIAFSPAILLFGYLLLRPLLNWGSRRSLTRESLALAGAWLVYPAVNTLLVLRRQSFGNSRYFVICTLMGTIAAIWLTSAEDHEPVIGGPRRGLTLSGCIAIAVVALTTVVTTVVETMPAYTKVENERVVFKAMLGAPYRKGVTEWTAWRRLAEEIDPKLIGDKRLLADVRYAFPLAVFSKRVDHMIVTNDTDFEQIVAEPAGRFQYILVPRPDFFTSSRQRDVVSQIIADAPASWRNLGEFGDVRLFEFIGPESP